VREVLSSELTTHLLKVTTTLAKDVQLLSVTYSLHFRPKVHRGLVSVLYDDTTEQEKRSGDESKRRKKRGETDRQAGKGDTMSGKSTLICSGGDMAAHWESSGDMAAR
jgi:hypothetical protein